MKQNKFLDILFNEGDTFCVSPNKKGYHSISRQDLEGDSFVLHSPPDAYNPRPINVKLEDIQLVALNPINGFRRDENATSYRTFLVEIDDGQLSDQYSYISSLGMPYSMCIYSGSKSLHFGITLDEDLPDEDTYRYIAEWILNIVEKADQKTKNPSRSIRFPFNFRKETLREQKALFLGERVSYAKLTNWLNIFPNKKPEFNRKDHVDTLPTINGIPVWVWNKLSSGVGNDKGRNNEWFGIFMEFAKAGYSADQITDRLQEYFTSERDFNFREWKTIAHSACKRVERGLHGKKEA